MDKAGAPKLVHFTTDMIYGHTVTYPMTEDHPVAPLGEYGWSKLKTEELAAEWRKRGMRISLFRPRLIIGPGRLGILEKLFKLIDWNLPVPMIGSGKNPYQFISVFDCAEAARLAWKAGVPNEAYNLGSLNPPPVRKLLGDLIKHAGSKSILIPTPGWAVKRTLDLLDLHEHADHGSRAVSDRRRGMRARRVQGRARARLGAAVPRRGHADRRLQRIPRQEGRPRRAPQPTSPAE